MKAVRCVFLAAACAASPALAQGVPQPSAPAPSTAAPAQARMLVTGRAVIETAPDVAVVSLGAAAKAATPAAAVDETSAVATKIIAAATAFGIERADITTSQIGVQPAFKVVRDGPAGQRLPDGFEASNTIQVRVRHLPKLGDFLRRGIGEGANRLNGLSFELLDRSRSEREAGAAAANDAQARAEALAAASGVKLGRILEIRWGDRGLGVPAGLRERAFAAPAADMPVEPGQISVAAEVEIIWAIEGGS